MTLRWFRHDREGVLAALRRRERPELATTMASGPLDELVALHDELGVFAALDAVEIPRERAGVPDRLLLRTLATLPFVAAAGLSGATELLFRDPAILLHLGWAPAVIRSGTDGRHRHPAGRRPESLPCHPDTLRDALGRIEAAAWEAPQRAGVRALFARRLVRGRVYAVDGTGLGTAYRVVALVCVSGERPVAVAWCVLAGAASEKGKEAAVTRRLVERALELGGPDAIELLLADALYADGPLLAWLKYARGIDALVPLPADRELYADLLGLAEGEAIAWSRHRFTRVVRGHKQARTVEVASAGELTSWTSFREAAADIGVPDAELWGCLWREVDPATEERGETRALVSTRAWADGFAAYQAYRPRWHIEDDAYRELKEGWGLEAHRWGRDEPAVHGRIALTFLAFNTAQAYRGRAGETAAAKGIRRLRRHYRRELGAAPCVLFYRDCYAVLPLEALLEALDVSPGQSLLPALGRPTGPAPPSPLPT
jgi:hypothetical protein